VKISIALNSLLNALGSLSLKTHAESTMPPAMISPVATPVAMITPCKLIVLMLDAANLHADAI
jgi:hypothetical protein